MKSTVWMLTLLSLLSSVSLIACSDSTDTPQVSGTTDSMTETFAETEETAVPLNLPEVDYEQRTFTVLATEHASYEYVAEESGDIVEDAVYRKNRAVEERLGIAFEFITAPGHWADKDSFNALIKNSIMANDGAYDLISGTMVCVLPIAAEGYFLNALDLEHIQFENPWWVQDMKEKLAIGGKLFGFVGDASLSLYKDLSVIYFNQKLIADYDLEDPYALVIDGKWTVDKVLEMAAAVSSDVNGDGKMTIGDDLFGYYYHAVPQRTWQTATEFSSIAYDDHDMPYMTPLQDRDTELFFKVLDFFERENVVGIDGIPHPDICAVFAADQVLFLNEFLYGTDYLRDMKSDFGIVPQPKRDEAQTQYHTQVGTSTSTFFIPTTVTDAELTSMVCEALSYYSWLEVIPAYYEVALKEKYNRDDTVKEMLNIIRDSAEVNFTFAYSTMFNPSINELLPSYWQKANNDVASWYAKNEKSWTKTIESIVEQYQDIES
ncbi:MAG: hypothetical protein IJW77_18970 [Clostridia bacterium]|nr:hypothetical protein [Clostridia bacterium]